MFGMNVNIDSQNNAVKVRKVILTVKQTLHKDMVPPGQTVHILLLYIFVIYYFILPKSQ